MRLRRLEIVGFKSFANKSIFLLDGSVTVLAGPNGSGKSNVAEAVRWVLGEQRPSALRSRKADEVIFLGSASRAPVGMAEVSLVMDNADGRLGDQSEVRFTRRIYRSGESEYLLNGRKVRLRDITERLLAVGLGPDTYTVIGQGAVDELIAQKPEERRVALENAADVRRHQLQLNETRSRLTTTEENLVRCRDVLAELEPQVRRMRSHADRAARAREIRQELHRVMRMLYRHQYRGAQQRRAAAETRAVESRTALELVEQELAARESRWKALETETESLGQLLTAADQTVRELRRRRDALQRQNLDTREEELRIESETRAVSERRERLEREHREAQARLQGLVERRASAEAKREQARAQLGLVGAEERALGEESRARRDALVSASTQLMQLRAQIDRERQVRESTGQKVAALRATHAGVAQEMVRLDAAVDAAQRAVQVSAESAAAQQVELETAETDLAESDQSIARLDSDLQRARGALRGLEQELARQEAAHASLDESLKRLVTDAAGSTLKRAERGVLGVFGPALRVKADYERVIGAALEERVGHVVIATRESAHELARKVIDADERAALLLARFNDDAVAASMARFRAVTSSLAASGHTLEYALDAVECDPPMQPALDRLLGHTLVVESVDVALRLIETLTTSEAAGLPWQIVTRDGQVLRWNGEWRAGSDQRQVRLLAGRAELSSLETQIHDRRTTAEAERTRLTAVERELQLVQERRGQLRSSAQRARAALNAAAADADRQRRSLAQAQQARAASESRHASAEAQLQALEDAMAGAQGRLAELTGRIAQQEEQRTAAQAAVQGDDARMAELRERLAAAQRESAEAGAQLAAVADEQGRETRLLSEIQERTQALGSVEAGLQTQREQLEAATVQQRAQIERIDTELPEADRKLESLLATMNQLSGRRAALDAELNEHRGRVRQAQTVHDAANLDRERAIEELTRLEREISEELEDLGDERSVQITLDLDDRKQGEPHEPEGDPQELQREVRSLKRELARLGPVDDSAVSEYQELIDRYEFLTQQSGDLETASGSLRSAMADLEVLIQQGLDTTLAEVNGAFQRTFERLFKGGEARLVWSAPDNPIASGIDIVAQPPGKRLQPLGNFSGGERALASVALVFALLQVNPTPFCVLDEVDAALDESNVGRFADIIREWSARTQFIVVTHNRNTMEIADALFGISMDTHGVSRVVSLKLDEVLAAAEG